MKKNLKQIMLVGATLLLVQGVVAQSIPTLEMQRNAVPLANANYGPGASIIPVVTEFRNDALNSNSFSAYTPQSTFTVKLTNQQFTGLNYGTANYNGIGVSTLQTTGLVFGIGPSLTGDPVPQGGNPYERYNIIGEYGGNGGPTNAMFTSNPTATGAQLGTGINVANASINTLNGAVEIFTTAQALYNNPAYPVGSRVYFGDLVIQFSQPVKNPVIHVAGLGGAYRYLPFGASPIPANYLSTFFATELELANPGYTSTLLSWNLYLQLTGNNILNNNNVNPNGGSILDPGETPFNNIGAATGSVRINGTVQTLVYRVYLKGGTGSQFAWSVPGTAVLGPGAPRDPFTGDIWYVAASYDKPVQQISGNVFNDRDGLTDNNINQSYGASNDRANPGTPIYANLLNSAGNVVATVPVTSGSYLFDNIPAGTYTVQLTINQGVVSAPAPVTALPNNWSNTGEFIGTGPGSDGTVNGISAPITLVANAIVSDVNFGIKIGCNANDLFYRPPVTITETTYFGGFEATPKPNFDLFQIRDDTKGYFRAGTNLPAAQYGVVNTPNAFVSSYYSYLPLSGQKQMVIKNLAPATNTVVWYLVDSLSKIGATNQYVFRSQNTTNFKAYFSKIEAGTNPQIMLKYYDADNPSIVYGTASVTITGDPGVWTLVQNNLVIDAAHDKVTKRLRMDIISVNGVPFSIDQLCTNLPLAGPLPIKLLSFTATKQVSTVQLNWQTSIEVNSKNFVAQHSIDGTNWSDIGTVAAAGNSTSSRSYGLVHTNPIIGVNYYRLKSNDLDANFEYSDIRQVTFTGSTDIKILPNPTTDVVYITTNRAVTFASVIVYAADGKQMRQYSNFVSGAGIELRSFARGTYMLKITDKQGNSELKAVVKN